MIRTLGCGRERAGACSAGGAGEAGGGSSALPTGRPGRPRPLSASAQPLWGGGPLSCQSPGIAESGHVLVPSLGAGALVLRAGPLVASVVWDVPWCSRQTR